MEDSFGFDDDDFLLAAVEQVEKQHQSIENRNEQTDVNSIDGDFDDFDDEDLILAADAIEQQVMVTHKEKGRQGQLTSFFTSRSTPLTTGTTRSVTTSRPESSTAASSRHNINDVLLPSRRLEDEAPPVAPAPPSPTTPCSHVFDAEALPTYLYPVNYPVRLYQWNIVKKALFNNTLVALPTGLGKTFIAAVVMYNYWRWFPQAKIVFMAPTRPLVTQQIEACFNICGIPQSDTIELTGQTTQERRRNMWISKRVFFLTPQVLQNDLRSRTCPAEKIVCLVVDEAHKAQGNYAYTEVVKLVAQRQTEFRVLALTATPGTNIANVQAVVNNLRIVNIQIRTEDSMDIQEHSYGKNTQTVIVPLEYTAGATGVVPDIARKFRTSFFVPALNRLSRFQAVYSIEVERNTPYQLLMAQKQFSAHAKNFNNAVRNMVFTDFSISHSLSRAYEMLCNHGVGSFLSTIEGTLQEYQDVLNANKRLAVEKMKLLNNFELQRMIEDLKQQQLQPGFMGHPKMQILLNILLEHLSQKSPASSSGAPLSSTSRVIVFSSYRSSVEDIVKCLSEHEPMVRCSQFVGQAGGKDGKKGLNQREQQEIITRFKRGDLNVLVSTSIGEEGLDIGEVDLIVCFDSQSSPLRLLQRMGRTGRKRKGRCVMLMTETEERKYKQAKESYNAVQLAIARGVNLEYFKTNPSVLPNGYHPVWRRKRFTIGTYIPVASSRVKGRNKTQKAVNGDGTLVDDVQMEFIQKLGVTTVEEAFNTHWPEQDTFKRSQRYLPMNTKPLFHYCVGHSRRTAQFIELYNKIDQRILHGVDAGDEEHQQQQPVVGNTLFLPRKRNGGGITVETHTMNHISSSCKNRRITVTDEYDDENPILFIGEKKKMTSDSHQSTITTATATSTKAPKSPTIPRRIGSTLSPYRHRSDTASNDNNPSTITTEKVASLQRNLSDVSLYDRSSPVPPLRQNKINDNVDIDNENDSNNKFDIANGYIQGDSWMEEFDSILLLENRLDCAGSFEQHTNDNGNISSGRMILEEFENILPPELKNPPSHTKLRDNNNTLLNNDDIVDNIKLGPFPFKQLTNEEAEQPALSPSMLNWLTRRPIPTESAEIKLRQRAKALKLNAAKEWMYTIFNLLPSPMVASTPSFDDDIDVDMLDALEQNLQQQQPLQEVLQKEYSLPPSDSQPKNEKRQLIQEQEYRINDQSQSILVNAKNDSMGSIIDIDSSSTNHMELFINKTVSQQQTTTTDNMRHNHEDEFASMSDITFYEVLKNKADEEGVSQNYVNECDSPGKCEEQEHKSINSSSLSPIVMARKRRRNIGIIEDDSEEVLATSLSSSPIMRRAIHGHLRQRQRLRKTESHNPYIELEAEKSSDEELMGSGHGNSSDEDISTSANDSFINDEEDTYSHHSPVEDVYRMGFISQATDHSNRRKTWLDKFQADKWIQAGEEEGDLIGSEEIDEDNEELETGTSAIREITDEICEYSDDFI